MLTSTVVYGFEMPTELQGNYIYPGDKAAGCQNKNYSLMIKKNDVNANEFNCKVTGKSSVKNNKYTIPMLCSSEDGSSKSSVSIELNGRALKFNQVDYLSCQTPVASSASTVSSVSASKLPNLCMDIDLIGGPKRIFKNKDLSKLEKDMDSMDYTLSPEKIINIGGKVIYQGYLGSRTNGHDLPGTYYIDAKEWGTACK